MLDGTLAGCRGNASAGMFESADSFWLINGGGGGVLYPERRDQKVSEK